MLNSNALTTVSRLADFMGIDTPAEGTATYRKLEARINSISNFIQRYTGMTFKKTTYNQEWHITEKTQTLNLKNYPVISSEPFVLQRRNSQLNEDSWETVDGEYYVVDYDAGIIQAMGGIHFFRGPAIYRVSYTAGYDFDNDDTFLGDTLAGDVELALHMIAQDFENNTGSGGNVKRERLGDYDVTYADARGSMLNNADATAILDYYKDLIAEGPLTPLQSI